MQEKEIAKGSTFALALTLTYDEIMDFAQELREAKAALLDWKKKRKNKCARVQLTVAGPSADHAEVQKMLDRLVKDKAEPGPFLQGLSVEVSLLNDKGKKVKEYVLGDKQAVAKGPPPAGPGGGDDDDEDDKGSYILVDAPATPEVKEEKKAKPQDKAVIRKIKKKKVQFARKWQNARLPLILFVVGIGVGAVTVIIQIVIFIFPLTASVDYNKLVMEELFTPKEQLEIGEHENLKRIPFAIGCVMGNANIGLGKTLYILTAVLHLVQSGVWLAAACILLAAPDRFGSRGQVFAIMGMAGVNLLLVLIFKLLPLVGASEFTSLAYAVPELPMSPANQERITPLQVQWSFHLFGSFFFGLLFNVLLLGEPILFCIYLHHVGLSIQDEWMQNKGLSLTQLGFSLAFIQVAYHTLSIAGASAVLVLLLVVVAGLYRGFLLWFIVWCILVFLKSCKQIADIVDEEDVEEEEEEEEEEDEEEDDYDDEND